MCTIATLRYRKTIDYFVGQNDTVLELGCQRDTTTEALLRATNDLVIGVDICRGKEKGKAKDMANGRQKVPQSTLTTEPGNVDPHVNATESAELRFVRGGVGAASLQGQLPWTYSPFWQFW